jgi:hypothetical protein
MCLLAFFAAKCNGLPLLVTKFKFMPDSFSSFYIKKLSFKSIASCMGSQPSLVHLFTSIYMSKSS